MGPVHATTVARTGPAGWRAALVRGRSGSGKSDLAVRLIDGGWRLVADDYTHVWRSDGALYGRAPDSITGWIEARGVGILTVPERPLARIILLVDCVTTRVERLPEPVWETVADVRLPRLVLDVRPASAVQTLGLVMDRL